MLKVFETKTFTPYNNCDRSDSIFQHQGELFRITADFNNKSLLTSQPEIAIAVVYGV